MKIYVYLLPLTHYVFFLLNFNLPVFWQNLAPTIILDASKVQGHIAFHLGVRLKFFMGKFQVFVNPEPRNQDNNIYKTWPIYIYIDKTKKNK